MTTIYYTLSEKGQKELLAAIQGISTEKLTNPDAYFADAEESADGWNNDEAASIEIEGKYTQSGNPEIIQLKKEWFDVDAVSCMTKEELLHVVRIQQEQNEELRALLAEQHEQMMAIGAGGVTAGKLMFSEAKEQK